ncbi:hypothetical protein [Bifidobacterium oedipodis]|uniref:Uncharacterized protein n=1 Tax=Bifidobacterium oedipodis TaxID=2675322 RepID=A0A7Y0EPQ6_9BIFI|nr:hypothetical protein [Bifidobacterium sp. DSM 109957]NMM92981.1 hypothetical protein [Bifidobacterium sp. DSM 109957]
MNNHPIERHISITRTCPDGTVSQTEVHVTSTTSTEADGTLVSTTSVTKRVSSTPGNGSSASVSSDVEGCFDPSTCCDAREQAIIAALRAYLRPDQAPECLMAKLKATLDHCCCDEN